jgi:hypothetical protein
MKRPKPNRNRSRDQIRYRLHTSIQAAAFLGDDPSREEIDRELQQIMATVRTKSILRPAPEPDRSDRGDNLTGSTPSSPAASSAGGSVHKPLAAPQLNVRAAAILLLSFLVGGSAAVLAYLTGHSVAGSALAGGSAATGTISLLNKVIGL